MGEIVVGESFMMALCNITQEAKDLQKIIKMTTQKCLKQNHLQDFSIQ